MTDLAGLVPWLLEQIDDENMPDLHLRTCQTLRPVPPGAPAIFGGVLTCDCGMVDWWLRDAEAKRQIIEEHAIIHRDIGFLEEDEGDLVDAIEELPVCGRCVPKHSSFNRREDIPLGYCRTVRLLAAPFADRSGYLDEWRP